jgi:hypothetical protein
MTTTLTFRLPKKQRNKLRSRAKALGKSEAALLRDLLDRELEPKTLGERIGHLAGTLGEPTGEPDEWEKSLRAHNWRA